MFGFLSSIGRQFQSVGAATAKDKSIFSYSATVLFNLLSSEINLLIGNPLNTHTHTHTHTNLTSLAISFYCTSTASFLGGFARRLFFLSVN